MAEPFDSTALRRIIDREIDLVMRDLGMSPSGTIGQAMKSRLVSFAWRVTDAAIKWHHEGISVALKSPQPQPQPPP